MTIVPHQSSWL